MCISVRVSLFSLRSKRFRLVSEQRKTKERGFRFWPMEREPNYERRGRRRGKITFLPHPSPLFYSRHFTRGLWLWFLAVCSETARKHLLRTLRKGRHCFLSGDQRVYWEFKQRLFWAAHVNWNWVLVPFSMAWCYQICISKCFYVYKDNLRKNLGKTTAKECKKDHFRLMCAAQKTSLL